MAVNTKDVIPAGSPVPEEETPTQETTTEQRGEEQTTADKDEGDLLSGKYKSPEELEKAYNELQVKLGQQKSEIGDLRKTVSDLSTKLAPEAEAAPANEMPDFKAMTAELEGQIEDGEISVAEGLRKLAEITRMETAAQMEQKFDEYDKTRTAKSQYEKFINDNPDFIEMKESGELQDAMRRNPMHDEFSAYFEVKAQKEAALAFEKGKEEALKIAKGADGTRSVLAKPGVAARDTVATPKKGLNDGEKVEGMMAALQAARGQ